jgi:glutamyl-tRNA synthetase
MIEPDVIKAYALKNAIEHNGRAIAGSVLNSLFNEGLKKERIKEIMPEVLEILNEVNFYSPEEQKKQFEALKNLVGKRPEREGLAELEGVKGKVIMRFAPSASGPFHIGHALTSSISYLYVQKYGGKFYIRIEDTNPENSFKDSYKLIKGDCDWLFNKDYEIVIQSDRLEVYYQYIQKLLERGYAYICECESERFRELLLKKKACNCRELSKKQNLERWEKMLDKKGYKGGMAVVRFKSDLNHKNPAMRDFPLARINISNHPIKKKKFRVWPLMNLAVAVDDLEEGMTHVIRGKDHRDNAERQKMIFKALGKESKVPKCYFLGRIHFKDLELSTSGFREGIKKGRYKGWDDSKLPTLISLRKRGYKPEAFHKFACQIGLSESDKVIDKKEFFLLLDNFNKI